MGVLLKGLGVTGQPVRTGHHLCVAQSTLMLVEPEPKSHCSLHQCLGPAVPQFYQVTVLRRKNFTTVFKKLNSYPSEWL